MDGLVSISLLRREIIIYSHFSGNSNFMGVRMGVENLNAMMDLGVKVDLESLHDYLGKERKHTIKRNSLKYQIPKPKASVEVFSSGKVVFTGLLTLGDMITSKDAVLRDLEGAGMTLTESPNITITNIVASGDLGLTLDLTSLYLKLGPSKAEYEPEQFPGLIYKLEDPTVTMLLFNNGKMICTGTADAGEASRAADIMYEKIKEIMKG